MNEGTPLPGELREVFTTAGLVLGIILVARLLYAVLAG